jgi:hypothetical protein
MRNANREFFHTDSYVGNEKEREFLIPAQTAIGLKLLNSFSIVFTLSDIAFVTLLLVDATTFSN